MAAGALEPCPALPHTKTPSRGSAALHGNHTGAMPSPLSRLPQRTCMWGAYPHSAHVQPASWRGGFGPKASATQPAGMHPVQSRAGRIPSRQPHGSSGESQEPSLGNKAAVPLQPDGELHWPLSLKLACHCHVKPRAGLQEQCYLLYGILLPHAGTTEHLGPPTLGGRAGCQGSSPGFYIGESGALAPLPSLPRCGG